MLFHNVCTGVLCDMYLSTYVVLGVSTVWVVCYMWCGNVELHHRYI